MTAGEVLTLAVREDISIGLASSRCSPIGRHAGHSKDLNAKLLASGNGSN